MSFKIPQKQCIVNSDSQMKLLNGSVASDGTPGDPYDGYAVPVAGDTFILEGFLQELALGDLQDLPSGVKVQKETATAEAAQVATFQVTGATATEGAVFRIVFESLDGTPTDYQNWPVSKIYQLPNFGGLDSVNDIAEAMERVINADDDDMSMLTASATTDTVTLTAKDAGIKFNVYIDPVLSDIVGTFAVTTPAATGIHTYDYLKNIDWSRNLDFDRNQEWQPLKGVDYSMYTFQFDSVGFRANGNDVPGAAYPSSRTDVKIWVAPGASTLVTALDALVADANAI